MARVIDRTNALKDGKLRPAGEALIQAKRYCGEGRLAEAEALCLDILKAQPNRPKLSTFWRYRAPKR